MDNFLPEDYKAPKKQKEIFSNSYVVGVIEKAKKWVAEDEKERNEFIHKVLEFWEKHKGITEKQCIGLQRAMEYEELRTDEDIFNIYKHG